MHYIKKSLIAKVLLLVVVLIVALALSIAYFLDGSVRRTIEDIRKNDQIKMMRVLEYTLSGTENRQFHIKDGELYLGDDSVKGNTLYVDRMKELTGSISTIFSGDTRISTSLLNERGERVVGTALTQGEAYDAVFKEKRMFFGRNTLFGTDYSTVYQPIKSANGDVIGALFVGVPANEFDNAIGDIVNGALLTTIIVGGIIVLMVVFFISRMLSPIRTMTIQ